MTDCPKLAKRRKLEEDPDVEKNQNCNTPGMKKKTATSAPTQKTAHRIGISMKHKRKLSKLTNNLENPQNQK